MLQTRRSTTSPRDPRTCRQSCAVRGSFGVKIAFKSDSKMRSNFRLVSEPSWGRFWADLQPILGSKLALFGLNCGAFFRLVFDTLCKTILERFWCHLGVQVGGKNAKSVKQLTIFGFSLLRVGAGFGSRFGGFLGLLGGPSWPPRGIQFGPKIGYKTVRK